MSTPNSDPITPNNEEDSEPEPVPIESSPSASDSDSDPDSDDEPLSYIRPDGTLQQIREDSDDENIPEVNIPLFNKILSSKRLLAAEEEEEEETEYPEEQFDFPPDPENWKEEDLKELWADAPIGLTKPGWDPHNVDEDEMEVIRDEIKAGRDPPIAPFYVPYRKYYPVIPDNHYDISNPKSVIEELDRIEEFMIWVSYIFEDGSTYEGTVWDDLAHGKGVYTAEQDLVRYEGEWLQNEMEGHGVVEVEIPQIEPIPGSKLEAKMRAEGRIISRDYMTPEDREWLEMDIEDSLRLANGEYEIPFYENNEWIRQFGQKPEKGRYRYAGEWKQGRMHGCGVYEVNERTTWGRFYFGELLQDPSGCDAEICALHAGIAEVAAAKARMFINKPDGMVREDRGPYSDPQHPYLYEDEDVWMAPGFINQFYEVPDYWKMYVNEVDQERELWLNSFYKAPLRLPMPSELEYWWAKEEEPEFVLINKEPEPDPENPSELIYKEDPVILHTPTGRIIDYVEDEEHGVRLFWQPPAGEDSNPDEAEFLPLGLDEFYGREDSSPQDSWWVSLLKSMEGKGMKILDGLDKWAEEKKKETETKLEVLQKEMELEEAELELKEAMEDLDQELKMLQELEEEAAVEEEEVDAVEEGVVKEEGEASVVEEKTQIDQTPREVEEEEEEEEEEEDDDDDVTASSFGSVGGQSSTKNDGKGSGSGKSTFAATSLVFGSTDLVSLVPMNLKNQFLRWKEGRFLKHPTTLPTYNLHQAPVKPMNASAIHFPAVGKSLKMRCRGRQAPLVEQTSKLSLRSCAKTKAPKESRPAMELNILSFHIPVSIT